VPDIDNVIKGLECWNDVKPCKGNQCPYDVEKGGLPDCRMYVCSDALTLLKELKTTVRPIMTDFTISVTVAFNYECECGAPMLKDQPYCMRCGKKVEW